MADGLRNTLDLYQDDIQAVMVSFIFSTISSVWEARFKYKGKLKWPLQICWRMLIGTITFMGMVTALSGAFTNIILNLVLIPIMGANGAAVATVISFIVVFVFRGQNTRKYLKFDMKPVTLISETLILALQGVAMLVLEKGVVMYCIEGALFVLMLLFNIKPIKELITLVLGKFLPKKKA